MASGRGAAEKAPEFDVLITAEAKGIPLVYEMARQSGKPYFIARKYPKLYMPNPISVQVRSSRPTRNRLCIWDEEEERHPGRRVLIVDDVISTGESLHALEMLVERSEGLVARTRRDPGGGRRREAGGYFLPGASAAVCRLALSYRKERPFRLP